jgi:hypothetical protein
MESKGSEVPAGAQPRAVPSVRNEFVVYVIESQHNTG